MSVDGDQRRAEGRHDDAVVEEWLFTCWLPPDTHEPIGVVSGYRILRDGAAVTSWYWAAVARPGAPLLHVADWHVPPRPDPLLVKGDGLWAEHVCDAPMEQWTVSNETYATALDDPDDALGRAYGTPTAVAFDLEWYATAAPSPVPDGYEQAGVVHGVIELAGGAGLHLDEAPAHRWHRWADELGPVVLPPAFAHTGVRAPFAFPDGTVADWALTPEGWRSLPR
ncbi:hypothetical protein [Desertimonas flava]|uniref:hypothetical protein n=1 Tax=Desertimonas flava TaxID=2064846 RepID=UPI000E348B19|nr:hypothetical protein [Desertimonas flava]